MNSNCILFFENFNLCETPSYFVSNRLMYHEYQLLKSLILISGKVYVHLVIDLAETCHHYLGVWLASSLSDTKCLFIFLPGPMPNGIKHSEYQFVTILVVKYYLFMDLCDNYVYVVCNGNTMMNAASGGWNQ